MEVKARAEASGKPLPKGFSLILPEIDHEEYMVDLMTELSPMRSNGTAATWTDWDVVLPFAQAKFLDPVDTYTLAQMCKAYYIANREGEDPLSISPMERKN